MTIMSQCMFSQLLRGAFTYPVNWFLDPPPPMIKFIDADYKHEINSHDAATTWWMEDSNVEGIKDIGVSFLLLSFG